MKWTRTNAFEACSWFSLLSRQRIFSSSPTLASCYFVSLNFLSIENSKMDFNDAVSTRKRVHLSFALCINEVIKLILNQWLKSTNGVRSFYFSCFASISSTFENSAEGNANVISLEPLFLLHGSTCCRF